MCDEIFGEENLLLQFSLAKADRNVVSTEDTNECIMYDHRRVYHCYIGKIRNRSERDSYRFIANPNNDPRGRWQVQIPLDGTAALRPNQMYDDHNSQLGLSIPTEGSVGACIRGKKKLKMIGRIF